ncbi:ATP-binding protein [Halovivax limisalsi]|uniref:ATP-binding protein n=1 Tax=Halovivax limisalsi TaxID=1453760 RepID=UPI001FFC7D07|nr:tetratricopeptide repeat protein [Halovivax limisalsi]
MDVPGVDALVLVALARADADESTAALTATAIADRIDLPETMAARVSLLSTLSEMASDGLVEAVSIDDEDADANAYTLTAQGRSRARTVLDRYESATVTARADGEHVEATLAGIADRFDLDLVTAMARLSSSGEVTIEATLDTGFFDRKDERDTADGLFEAAATGETTLFVIEGEAGVGKTMLFRECRSMAAERGFETLVGQADPDRSDPYHALTDAVPWAIEHLEEAPVPTAESATTNQSLDETVALRYGAIADELRDRASETPIMLGIEDMQWADAASISLLASLLEGLESAPIAIVLTVRSGESADDPRLSDLTDAASCETTVCELEPFDRADVRELIERRVGRRGVPEACLDAIYEHTGGVGLFVEETVDDLLDRGVIDPQRGTYPESLTDVPLPSVVESTIADRLDRLDEATRRVLEVAAVAGTSVSLSTLRAVAADSSRLHDQAQLLVDGRVWERLDDERFRFASHVLRSTVLETLEADRRASLERRVADHLAERADPPHAEIARRYDRAGDAEAALEHAMAAGETALDVFAHEDAVDAFQHALGLARDLDRDDEVIEALDSLANVYRLRGEYDAAHTHLRYVRSHADDVYRIRATYSMQAVMHNEVGEFEVAIDLVERGLELDGPRSEAYFQSLDVLASAYFHAGEFRKSIATARFQYDLADATDDDLAKGQACFNMGRNNRSLGRPDRAIEFLEEARELYESSDDPIGLSGCLNDLGISYITTGRYEEGVEAMERCEELAEETGDVGTAIHALNNLGIHAIGQGDWAEARERYDRLQDLAARVGNDRMAAHGMANEGVIDLQSTDIERARETFETALELSRSIGHDHQATFGTLNLATVEMLSGEFDRAARHASEALDRAREDEYVRAEANAMRLQGLIMRERGDFEAAVERHREALDRARESGNEIEISKVARDLADSLIAVEEIEDALERAEEARETAPEGFRIDQLAIEATRGRALTAAGDAEGPETLRSVLEEAIEIDLAQVELQVCRDLAWLALDSGDRSDAIEHLDRGLALAVETSTRLQEAWFAAVLEAVRDDGIEADALQPVSGPFDAG